ncbi:MAG: DUF6647 family protein [Pseudomonadota bacterium]
MPLPNFSGLARAGLAALVLATGPALAGDAIDPPQKTILSVVRGLEHWLDRASPYPARREIPAIVFIDAEDARAMRASSGRLNGRLRGLYAETSATIYLVRPWDAYDPHDASVLLHELVHHRQATARHWYCDNAKEWDAYKLQERWLADLGLDAGLYWPAILLQSSCTPRDIHPD